MTARRWVRVAVVTALTVAAALAATTGTAQALPSRCDTMLDRISNDWDEYSNYAAWAGINAHDGDWQDYAENMNLAAMWATQAQDDTASARRAHCF